MLGVVCFDGSNFDFPIIEVNNNFSIFTLVIMKILKQWRRKPILIARRKMMVYYLQRN